MGAYPGGPFESVVDRHRALMIAGRIALLFGAVSGGWVVIEWYVYATGHLVITIVSGISILLGTQLLIFAHMASMLITLYHESRNRET